MGNRLLGLLISAAMIAAIAMPAHAATVHRFTYVKAAGEESGQSLLTKTTHCETGRMVGAGGTVFAKNDLARLVGLSLDDDGDMGTDRDNDAVATAAITNLVKTTVTSTGVCMNPTDAASLTYANQQYTLPTGSFGIQSATLACAGGSVPIGGGALLTDNDGQKADRLIQSAPSATGWSWAASYATAMVASTVDVTVVCAPTGTFDITPISKTVSIHPSDKASATAKCPKGTTVASDGFSADAFETASTPYDSKDKNHVLDNGWKASAFTGGLAAMLTATALCVA